jgi:phosphotransferase system enzyme I (PtsI)
VAGVQLTGIGVSPGIAIGEAVLLGRREVQVSRRTVAEAEVPLEQGRFQEAVVRVRLQVEGIRTRAAEALGPRAASIFDSHLALLADDQFPAEVQERIAAARVNAEAALEDVARRYADALARLEDEVLRGRRTDVDDVAERLLRTLLGAELPRLDALSPGTVLVTHSLAPSEAAQLDRQRVQGFVTQVGGRTSHTAILARSLELPAVVGLPGILGQVQERDQLILDGLTGSVLVNPDRAVVADYQSRKEAYEQFTRQLHVLGALPAETADGYRVAVTANIEFPGEVAAARRHGAEGVGLYRTEFLYVNRTTPPTEEEHVAAYRTVAEAMAPNPVVIRTLDLGGAVAPAAAGESDLRGVGRLRPIRLWLRRPELFRTQLRAILRASVHGNLKVMFPLISGVAELREARGHLEAVQRELEAAGLPFNPHLEVGVMIETPAAAVIADLLAQEADFLSLGTNDLIQYTLAIERDNEQVASLYEPLHPAILRLVRNTIAAAHTAGIWVAMCGEVAGDPLYTAVLVALGIDELSMTPAAIPLIKRIIRTLSMREAVQVVHQLGSCTTAREVEGLLRREMAGRLPELFGASA